MSYPLLLNIEIRQWNLFSTEYTRYRQEIKASEPLILMYTEIRYKIEWFCWCLPCSWSTLARLPHRPAQCHWSLTGRARWINVQLLFYTFRLGYYIHLPFTYIYIPLLLYRSFKYQYNTGTNLTSYNQGTCKRYACNKEPQPPQRASHTDSPSNAKLRHRRLWAFHGLFLTACHDPCSQRLV